MKNSSYGPNYRAQILKSALNAFDIMVEEDRVGKKPLYRTRAWNKEKRVKDKEDKIKNYRNKSSKKQQ